MADSINARDKLVSVDSVIGPTAPVIQSAATSSDGLTVTYNYDTLLDTGSVPAVTDATFSPAKTITNVQVVGSTVIWTVSVAFGSGDTITTSYTAGTNPIQSLLGVPADNLTNYAVTNNVGGYSATAQAVINRMSNLAAGEADAIAAFVDSQASAEGGSGNWELLDEFYCFALSDANDALTGWKSKTAVNSGGTHGTQGYSFDGSPDVKIDTMWNPTADGSNYKLNDASAFVFCQAWNNATVDPLQYLLRTPGANSLLLRSNGTASDSVRAAINSTLSSLNPVTITTGKALYGVHRQNATEYFQTQDTTTSANLARASDGLPNVNISVSDSGGELNGTISAVSFGACIGFDLNNFDSNLDTLLVALGVTT